MIEPSPGQQPDLLARVEQISRDFNFSPDHVRRVTGHFVRQLKDGLANNRVWQLPAYITTLPTGMEKGEFLAVDLGGSNCRICLVQLHGNSTFNVVQSKHVVPPNLMVNPSHRPLFEYIAQKISDFLSSHGEKDPVRLPYKLGFTFSFTFEQTSIASGRLIHWDKGWDIPTALGRDPCAMLQEAIDEHELPVVVTVLANDSVGTLLTRSYTSGPAASTLGAVIFGTGTNAAYVEKLSNVNRIGAATKTDGIMVMNTEWGCLDDKMEVLPRTPFDDELDRASTEPGSQMFEKRVSGLYLGELLRLTILRLVESGAFNMAVCEKSPVFARESIDSSFLSNLAIVGIQNIETTINLIQDTLSVEDVSEVDALAIHGLASSIAKRAARLAGASLAALIIQSGRLEQPHSPPHNHHVWSRHHVTAPNLQMKSIQRFWYQLGSLWRRLLNFVGMTPEVTKPGRLPHGDCETLDQNIIDIGADGSLIELHPNFETEMRGAMREVPEVGCAGEKRVRIVLSKDGSGVGAALMAQAASQAT
ncbi:putative glucokinase [Aspergillus californicus]